MSGGNSQLILTTGKNLKDMKTISSIGLFVSLLVLLSSEIKAQTQVAITIDDVPNAAMHVQHSSVPRLLVTLDSLNVPVTAFVTTGLLFDGDSLGNMQNLSAWIRRDYVTLGYHSYAHLHLAEVGFPAFRGDFEKGEVILKKQASKYNKTVRYFRFPFNELGRDSLQQTEATTFVRERGFRVAPFTVESSDWMFDYVYRYYLSKNDTAAAARTGECYVATTLAYFSYFDSLSVKYYGREIKQIYLCHDNPINAAYLPAIISNLKSRGYSFISFDQALGDEVYSQPTYYYKKWGVSWFYRWMKDASAVMNCMKHEPSASAIEQTYNELQSAGKN